MFLKLLFIALLSFQPLFSYSQDTINNCNIEVPKVVCLDCEKGEDYLLKISSNCQLKEYKLTLFNRWGQELFKTKDISDCWDASKVKPGTFYWTIQGKYFNNEKIDISGYVSRL